MLSQREPPAHREAGKDEHLKGRAFQLSYPSAEALMSPWRQLASFHPVGACFTQTSIEPGLPKTDKHKALGTGSVLPSSHTPSGGGGHTLQCIPPIHPAAYDPDRRGRTLESQHRAIFEVGQLVVPSTLTWSAIIMAPYQPVTQPAVAR